MKPLHTYSIGRTGSRLYCPVAEVVVCDLCFVPQSTGYQKGQSDQAERCKSLKNGNALARRFKSDGFGFKSQFRQRIFSHKNSTKVTLYNLLVVQLAHSTIVIGITDYFSNVYMWQIYPKFK